MKYVIFNNETAVIFPDFLDHKETANAVSQTRGIDGKPTSAGFVNVDEDNKLYTHGKSVSLDLKSKKDDIVLIMRQLSFY